MQYKANFIKLRDLYMFGFYAKNPQKDKVYQGREKAKACEDS